MGSIWNWSTTAASNDRADSGINWAEGQDPNTVNDSARAMMGRVAEFIADLGGTPTATGTNDLVLTATSGFTSLADGLIVGFKVSAANTGAMTLNVNGTGAVTIRDASGTALSAGTTATTIPYVVMYSASANAGAGAWILLNGIKAADSAKLNGQAASYYTDIPTRLGYTPINKAGDTGIGALTLTSTLSVGGTATLASTLSVGGTATVTGAFSTSGTATAATSFISSTTSAEFATTGAGTVYLRPNGSGSITGQTVIASTGAMTVNGTLTVTG